MLTKIKQTVKSPSEGLLINISKDMVSGYSSNDKCIFLANSKIIDRSIRSNNLKEFGTITESPASTNTELMAYSGFSASNYLEQPYNLDLNFGTGDFHIMGWVKINETPTNGQIIYRRSDSTETSHLSMYISTDGYVKKQQTGFSDLVSSSPIIDTDNYHLAVYTRKNGIESLYMDGVINSTNTNTSDVTLVNATIIFGRGQVDTLNVANKLSLALFRIGTDVPSDDQIKEIYESEKLLFQENTACTLSSTTDSIINALSYNEYDQELNVAGSDNLDTFKGLVRTKSEVGVYTSLSSSNDIVVKGN